MEPKEAFGVNNILEPIVVEAFVVRVLGDGAFIGGILALHFDTNFNVVPTLMLSQ